MATTHSQPAAGTTPLPPNVSVQGAGPVLSKDEAHAIAKRVLAMATMPATVRVQMGNAQNTRFSRNEITTQLDNRNTSVRVYANSGTRTALAVTQRFDDEGLREAVRWAEAAAKDGPGEQEAVRLIKPRNYPEPPGLWADATGRIDLDSRIQRVTASVDKTKGYLSAGSMDVTIDSQLVANSEGLVAYCANTEGSLQVAARSMDGTGSGWSAKKFNDVGQLQPDALAGRAVDKCERSRNPEAIEPGRYTVILEPNAYAQMVFLMMMYHMGIESAEQGFSVFANPKGGTKIGLKMLDDRLSFVSDPMDADGPFCPFTPTGVPFDRTFWLQDGILKNLSMSDARAAKSNREYALANPISVRLEPKAGTKLMTLQEMIETCDRGIYVTRLTTGFADFRYLVFTGVTRDGTWLIEKGKITKPIKNLRYLDSHLFFLNNLEAIGQPELTLSGAQIVLPPVRARDFNFTALADAV